MTPKERPAVQLRIHLGLETPVQLTPEARAELTLLLAAMLRGATPKRPTEPTTEASDEHRQDLR
jgi:hypothetical protein